MRGLLARLVLVAALAAGTAPASLTPGWHTNYVRAALQSVAAGQPVKTPVTRAHGCAVKSS